MSLLNRLKQKFSSETEEIQVLWDESEELFKDRRKEEIETARAKSDEIVDRTEDIVQRLGENLEELKDYKDRDELDVVEDVAESFYKSRKRLVENFEPSDNIREHHQELSEFLNEFNDVSRKQGAVMQRIEKDSGQLSSSLDELLEHSEELEEFLENKYEAVKKLEQVSQLEKKIQDLKQEAKELEEELEDKEIGHIQSEISETEEEIKELKHSKEYSEKEELEHKLKRKKNEKKSLRKDISSQISQLERGLKKLTYNIENNGIDFENDLEKLQKLRNGEYEKVENPLPELKEALHIIRDEDLIDGRQLDKFEESVEALSSYDQNIAEIQRHNKDIGELEDRISEFEVEEKVDELKKQKENLERKLEDKREEIENRKERIEEIRENIGAELEKLEEKLDRHLNAEVKVEKN